MLKIGDRVKFLSNTSVGVVTKIEKEIVWVDIEEGFEIPSDISDIVAVSKEQELEAISSIGAGDERPGKKRGKAQPKKEKEVKKEREAYKRYGKISLVNDEDLDDDEDIIDLYEIKERYTRTLLATREREQQIEQEQEQREMLKARDIEVSEVIEDVFAQAQPSQEPQKEQTLSSFDELSQKIAADKLPKSPQPKKEALKPDMDVIDLHAHELLETTEGMSNGEIITAQLTHFSITLESRLKSRKSGKVVYIHGVGKGRLRYEIERLLRSKYPKCQYQDASFKEYGFGAVLVMY